MKTKKTLKTLARLVRTWDAKLARTGFVDIEDRKTGLLKKWAIVSRTEGSAPGYSAVLWKISSAEYYRQAARCLFTKTFRTELHRRIWELHSEGISGTAIARKLRLTHRQVKYAIVVMKSDFGLYRHFQGSDNAAKQPHTNKTRGRG